MAEEKARKGWFSRKEAPEEHAETGIEEVTEPGPVKHIHFDGDATSPAPPTEREYLRVETTTYKPHHNATMEDIHRDVDSIGRLPRTSSTTNVTRTRTVYTTERGAVTKTSEGNQSALYVSEKGGAGQKRFTSSLVDPIIEDVDLAAPARRPSGPYVHNGYTLHSRNVELKGGGEQVIYFFSKKKPKSGSPCAMPEGYEVGVNERTGLPYLFRPHSGGEKEYKPQCSAITDDGKQCRNSARGESKYCSSHAGYHPKNLETHIDTAPVHDAKDTKAGSGGKGKEGAAIQCSAVTGDGKQCRNNAREGKGTCASHKNYRAPSKAKVVARLDTKPRWSKAKDTKPKTRKASRPKAAARRTSRPKPKDKGKR